jgi:hypothetical protein
MHTCTRIAHVHVHVHVVGITHMHAVSTLLLTCGTYSASCMLSPHVCSDVVQFLLSCRYERIVCVHLRLRRERRCAWRKWDDAHERLRWDCAVHTLVYGRSIVEVYVIVCLQLAPALARVQFAPVRAHVLGRVHGVQLVHHERYELSHIGWQLVPVLAHTIVAQLMAQVPVCGRATVDAMHMHTCM